MLCVVFFKLLRHLVTGFWFPNSIDSTGKVVALWPKGSWIQVMGNSFLNECKVRLHTSDHKWSDPSPNHAQSRSEVKHEVALVRPWVFMLCVSFSSSINHFFMGFFMSLIHSWILSAWVHFKSPIHSCTLSAWVHFKNTTRPFSEEYLRTSAV